MAAFVPDSDSEDELPAGWEERATLDGKVYYANHITRTTQWTHPRTHSRKRVAGSLPFGWKRELLDDGKVIYVNHETRKTTYTDPRLAFAVEEVEGHALERQRFDASTTADQILHGMDLSGQVAIVTGCSKGSIGFEVARSLAGHGCNVIIVARDLRKGEEAAAAIRSTRRRIEVNVEVALADLCDLNSIKRFVKNLQIERLDFLILSAGVMGLNHSLTVDGFETMFQTNYLANFLLCHLLEDLLKATPGSRLVILSSESHRFSLMEDFSRIPAQKADDFISVHAYNDSKLMALMLALELGRKWTNKVSCFAVHPGNMVWSNISRTWFVYRLIYFAVRPFVKSLKQAAGTVMFATASPEMRRICFSGDGIYINNCFPCKPSKICLDPEARQSLFKSTKQSLKLYL